MKTKLTTIEKRAEQYCLNLLRFQGGQINMEWKRSAMWGANPVISSYDGKCTNISGCGYDKESSALAQCLRFLFEQGSDAYNEVWGTGGAGFNSFADVMAKHGWKIVKVASGKMFDAYQLSVIDEGIIQQVA
jgi:hypothetical protein